MVGSGVEGGGGSGVGAGPPAPRPREPGGNAAELGPQFAPLPVLDESVGQAEPADRP